MNITRERSWWILSTLLALAACGGSAGSSDENAAGSSSGGEGASAPAGGSEGSAASGTEPEGSAAPDDGRTDAQRAAVSALQDYARRLMAAVRAHWQVPATISHDVAVTLEASVEIHIDAARLPTSYTITDPSGNAEFDASIERGLQALVAAGQPLPAPPEGLDDPGIRLRLRGR